jgi:beta-glucosidase
MDFSNSKPAPLMFPNDFKLGAATAAYQIEGAAFEDGRGLSVWDVFCRQPGKVYESHSGETACDHYHRYSADVALMREIGLQAYRMSVSWSRILPEGRGKINERGLDFYDRLVDELLAADIEPWLTLFHWDFPYELYKQGGWLNSASPDWFADYTRIVVERLSDRVSHWLTLNEPQCFIGLGHYTGEHAPGLKLDFGEVTQAAHHALIAHGKAVQTIRAYAKTPSKIGYAPIAGVNVPASVAQADVEATRHSVFSVTDKHLWGNTWWSDPIFFGHYPEDGLRLFGDAAPRFTAAEMDIIRQPLDFYGTNIYQAQKIRADAAGAPQVVPFPAGQAQTALRWNVVPEALYWGPKFLYERYKLPIVITENGLSSMDWMSLDGQIHDAQRIDYLHRYLQQFARAVADGVEALGYFHWSLMDNFEWALGYRERFGLIYVDYATGQRTLKDSAYWYKNLITAHKNTQSQE